LTNITGSIKTGEALAIIGGSGAGKTTFLNFLSKKIETSNLIYSGRVTLNDFEIIDSINKRKNSLNNPNITDQISKQKTYKDTDLETISAYVMQDDILEATMTPKEILLFSAKLKLNLPNNQIEERVFNMISKLNLERCLNTPVGNNLMRGVSGGERKRTSIGVELISDPKIIFLDEPTTGLDSYNAFEAVNLICNLAKKEGKIIIFTIHQPSSEIFSLLDKILILADGKNVYFGPSQNSINFFTNELKMDFPINYNPFEFFIEKTNLEVFNSNKIKSIKAYNDILADVEKKNDQEKLNCFSDYINLLSDIYAGNKKLEFIENSKANFIAINCKNRDYIEKYYMEQEEKNIQELGLDSENRDCKNLKEFEQNYIDKLIYEKSFTKGFLFEFFMLFGRNIIISTRNKKILSFKIVQTIFTSVLLSIIFKNVLISFY